MYVNLLIILLIKPSLPQQIHPKAIPKESCLIGPPLGDYSQKWTN